MNRSEFINLLDRSLGNIPAADKSDILYDYQEHFSVGMEQGKTEEEIAETLGDPRNIARQYRVDHIVKQAEETKTAGNMVRAIFAALSLGFFNLVFMLPIFFTLLGILIGLYGAALGITLGGAAGILAVVLEPVFPNWISLPDINIGIPLFACAGLLAMGILFFIGNAYITRFFYQITIRYIKANINVIRR